MVSLTPEDLYLVDLALGARVGDAMDPKGEDLWGPADERPRLELTWTACLTPGRPISSKASMERSPIWRFPLG